MADLSISGILDRVAASETPGGFIVPLQWIFPPHLTGDSGVASIPTARPAVFASGTPAATVGQDYGVATSVAAGANVGNPSLLGMTNPPSAAPDIGSA